MTNTITFKAIKMEYRGLGTGWKMVDNYPMDQLEQFISFHNIQEYIIHEIKVVNLQLETIELEFKGIKHIALTNRTLGSSKYDRDETSVKEVQQSEVVVNVNPTIETKEVKIIQTTKLIKSDYFIQLFNGNKEYFSNGYEFTLPTGHKAIVHKGKDNTNQWLTTLKDHGVSITNGNSTRKEAINAACELIERIGIESFEQKILAMSS